jgi:hypothetical protein
MLLERRQRALALFDEEVQKGLAAAPSVDGSGDTPMTTYSLRDM